MDRTADVDDSAAGSPGGENEEEPGPAGAYTNGGLAIEFRDRWLELRTSVCASENAVSHRWGTSVTGWAYGTSTTESCGPGAAAAADGPAPLSVDGRVLASRACCHGLLDTARCLPSLVADEFLRFPVRGGVASVGAPSACPSWGAAVRGLLWDLDRGALLGFGKRENPPAECGVDMAGREALLHVYSTWNAAAWLLF